MIIIILYLLFMKHNLSKFYSLMKNSLFFFNLRFLDNLIFYKINKGYFRKILNL